MTTATLTSGDTVSFDRQLGGEVRVIVKWGSAVIVDGTLDAEQWLVVMEAEGCTSPKNN